MNNDVITTIFEHPFQPVTCNMCHYTYIQLFQPYGFWDITWFLIICRVNNIECKFAVTASIYSICTIWLWSLDLWQFSIWMFAIMFSHCLVIIFGWGQLFYIPIYLSNMCTSFILHNFSQGRLVCTFNLKTFEKQKHTLKCLTHR